MFIRLYNVIKENSDFNSLKTFLICLGITIGFTFIIFAALLIFGDIENIGINLQQEYLSVCFTLIGIIIPSFIFLIQRSCAFVQRIILKIKEKEQQVAYQKKFLANFVVCCLIDVLILILIGIMVLSSISYNDCISFRLFLVVSLFVYGVSILIQSILLEVTIFFINVNIKNKYGM